MASPLDSLYGAGVARLLYENKRQRDDVALQGTQDTQDFNTMLQRLAQQRTQTLQNTNHGANREGLFYSGQLGKRRSNVEREYGEQEQDRRTDFDRRTAARASALQDLGTITAGGGALGYTATGRAGLDLNDMYNDAVGRQLERDRQTQLDGMSASQAQEASSAAAPPAAGGGAAAAGGYQSVTKNGKFYHVYNGGKSASDWRYVRPASNARGLGSR